MNALTRLSAVVFVLWSGGQHNAVANKPITKDDIRKAWAKRQARLQTLTLHWKRKYSTTWQDPPRGGPKPKDAPAVGTPYSLQIQSVVRFDGEKFDLRTTTENAKKYGALASNRCAFDGKQSRSLMVSTFPRHFAMGIVSARKHEFGPNSAAFVPLSVTLRPLTPTVARFEFKNLRLESGESEVNGHVCKMLTVKASKNIERAYHVDPKSDFVIRRIESRVKGRLSILWDISYSRDAKHGWLPSGWKMEWWSETGTSNSKSASKVTKWEIGKRIPGEAFHILFPADAKVIDKRKSR